MSGTVYDFSLLIFQSFGTWKVIQGIFTDLLLWDVHGGGCHRLQTSTGSQLYPRNLILVAFFLNPIEEAYLVRMVRKSSEYGIARSRLGLPGYALLVHFGVSVCESQLASGHIRREAN